jgi:hypothetical protein
MDHLLIHLSNKIMNPNFFTENSAKLTTRLKNTTQQEGEQVSGTYVPWCCVYDEK